MTHPYFDPGLVAQTFYINLARSPERQQRFEAMVEQAGLENLTHVEGVDGHAIDGTLRADIVSRTKNKVTIGSKLEDTMEENRVPDFPDRLTPDEEAVALGKYGCAASHLYAMKQALENHQPEDGDKWIVIFEDDVVLTEENREALNAGLANAPADTGAMMLSVMHPRGAAPIKTENDSIIQPTKGNSTTAIAFRPSMLAALIPVYEKNLNMSREEGGISPVDNVNCALHQYLAFGKKEFDNRPEYDTLVETFQQASEGMEANKFYALNPSQVHVTNEQSLIGGVATAHLIREDKLQAFPTEVASRIQDGVDRILAGVMGGALPPDARGDMKAVIKESVYEGKLSGEETVAALADVIRQHEKGAQQKAMPAGLSQAVKQAACDAAKNLPLMHEGSAKGEAASERMATRSTGNSRGI